MNHINYEGLPENLAGGMQRWIDNGVLPGGFLTVVLENDLSGAFGRADIHNREAMFEIVSWMYNEAPTSCWGSKAQVKEWREHKGFNELRLPLSGDGS